MSGLKGLSSKPIKKTIGDVELDIYGLTLEDMELSAKLGDTKTSNLEKAAIMRELMMSILHCTDDEAKKIPMEFAEGILEAASERMNVTDDHQIAKLNKIEEMKQRVAEASSEKSG